MVIRAHASNSKIKSYFCNPLHKASDGVEDPEFAITQLAQTTMRSEVAKSHWTPCFVNVKAFLEQSGRRSVGYLLHALRNTRHEDAAPCAGGDADAVVAERKKRAAVLEPEGVREAEVNVAEGRKLATILASEAQKLEQINQAEGEAAGIIAKAHARANAILTVSRSLAQQNGISAAQLSVAEQYIHAFSSLAKTSNTMILPSSPADPASMVAQALGIYKTLVATPKRWPESGCIWEVPTSIWIAASMVKRSSRITYIIPV